jgi:hypothetical protein
MDIGDDPVGIDAWEGEVKEAGSYKIKVAMGCVESYTTTDVRRKKPVFRCTLAVRVR